MTRIGVGAAPQLAGHELGAGVQAGQRGAQLVADVGGETALAGQGLTQRCDRPPGEDLADQQRGQQPGELGGAERAQQALPFGGLVAKVDHRLGRHVTAPLGAYEIALPGQLDLGDPRSAGGGAVERGAQGERRRCPGELCTVPSRSSNSQMQGGGLGSREPCWVAAARSRRAEAPGRPRDAVDHHPEEREHHRDRARHLHGDPAAGPVQQAPLRIGHGGPAAGPDQQASLRIGGRLLPHSPPRR